MEANKDIIWKKLQEYSLDDPSSEYKFSDRLAKENKWSKKFSLHIIEEYKKFIFLSVFAGHPVTPSKKLDEVWHLHLLYTRSYWEDMCDGILGRKIHHGPTKGGKKEDDRYSNLYGKTLDSYRRFFGDPPQDVWFDTNQEKRWWEFPKIAACFTPILLSGFISIQNPWLIAALIIGIILLMVIVLILASTDTGKSKRASEENSAYRNIYSDRKDKPLYGSLPPSKPSSVSVKNDNAKKSSASGNSNNNSNGCTTYIPYSCSSSPSKSSDSGASSCSSASCSSGSSCGSSCGGGGCGGGD